MKSNTENKGSKIKEITSQIEEGVKEIYAGDNYKNYLKTMAKFHNYSVNNQILISIQNPFATQVAGYQTWKNKFHRNVKKGEKGIKIIAPCPWKATKEMTKVATGETVEMEVSGLTFRAVTVFDISQTEGENLQEVANLLTSGIENYSEIRNAIVAASPVPVKFKEVEGSANGLFDHEKQEITIDSGLSEAQAVKTLLHEIAHAKMHNLPVEESEKLAAEDPNYKNKKEVQAESVAYTLCNYYGLDTSDYSFGYIALWSTGKDLKELKESLNVIRQTVADLIETLDNNLKIEQKVA